jgi:hypothetical protein
MTYSDSCLIAAVGAGPEACVWVAHFAHVGRDTESRSLSAPLWNTSSSVQVSITNSSFDGSLRLPQDPIARKVQVKVILEQAGRGCFMSAAKCASARLTHVIGTQSALQVGALGMVRGKGHSA